MSTGIDADKQPLMVYTPDPKRQVGLDIVALVKGITRLEQEFEKLDTGESDYHTIAPQITKARAALNALNMAYQARIYRRQNGDRKIETGIQKQFSPRRY